jgi:hypothetical protein
MDEPKEGHYGGDTAAPAFKEIAERAANYLNIRPEDGVQPVPEPAAAAEDVRAVRTAAVRLQ